MSETPIHKEGISACSLGNEWFLHDKNKGDVHVINGTARFIWDLCDGHRTVEDMGAKVRDSYDVAGDVDLNGLISGILRQFRQLDLLDWTD